jgi:hypothetical protein
VKNDTTRTELMAIPIVVVLFGIGLVLFIASVKGVWAWLFVGLAGLLLLILLIARLTKRHPHPAAAAPVPQAAGTPVGASSTTADGTYRILVIADASCVDPAFPAELVGHANGRTIEALVIAPAIGSWLSRWTGDESQFADARKHLDDTVAALASAGITARGETGADDPLQAADDGLREFAADEIVFVTKPGTDTDWVERGVVETAKTRYSVPVTHRSLPTA